VESWHVEAKIGEVMLKAMKLLEAHSTYCEQYSKSVALRQDVLGGKVELEGKNSLLLFQQFLQVAKLMPQADLKSLEDLLIMPVQRVPRYKLLLTELYEKTPKNHPDFKDLQHALNLTQHLALSINENTRQAEATERYFGLQEVVTGLETLPENSQRGVLDRRDKLLVLGIGGKLAQVSVILMTDGVLFCLANKKTRASLISRSDNPKPLKVAQWAPYNRDLAVELAPSAELQGRQHENVLTIGSVYVVMPSPEAAQEWLRVIKERIQKIAPK